MKSRSSSDHGLPLLPVALIYFVLFLVSVLANIKGRFLVFPKIQEGFFETMAVDLIFAAIIATTSIGVLHAIDKTTTLFRDVTVMFRELFSGLGLSDCFFLSAFSALGEEFFFRGFIQSHAGLWVTAIVFGLVHMGPQKNFWPWTLSAIFMGLLLGYTYDLRQNMLVPVVIHFLVNLVNLMALRQEITTNEDSAEKHPV